MGDALRRAVATKHRTRLSLFRYGVPSVLGNTTTTSHCSIRHTPGYSLEYQNINLIQATGLLVMAIPWNIRGSASQLFFQDKTSPQYKALLAIANVPHPDRSILGAFINDAVDPQEAARYFLNKTDGSKSPPEKTVSQFLSEWKVLIEKCK